MQMINDKRVLCSIIMKRVYGNFVMDAFKKINKKTSLSCMLYCLLGKKFAIDYMKNEPGVPGYIVKQSAWQCKVLIFNQ